MYLVLPFLAKIIGALGLLLATVGILKKQKCNADVYFVFGGVLLFAYSVYIKDVVFIILQTIFTVSAVYDFKKKGCKLK